MKPSRLARLLALLGLVFFAHAVPARAQPRSTRPNIVLIVADDLGPGDLGAYGQDRILTPNLDALARSGLVFRQAYSAAPVCAPSRCALLTGLFAEHCSVTENARPNVPLSFEEVNLGLLFGAAGYRTAMIGKWGLGGELRDGSAFTVFSRPERVGFDVFAGLLDQETAEYAYFAALYHGDERRVIEGNTEGRETVWGPPLLLEEALAFLDTVPSDQPFFLYFAPTLPHREYRVPAIAPAYAAMEWPAPEQAYATMVSELDAEVGALLQRIALRGLEERTFIVFTSDNGPNGMDGHSVAFFDSSAGLRGQKRDLYEGGLRVPLLVRGPGIAPGERSAPVALYDLFPTFAELAEIPSHAAVDGLSLAPLLSRDGPLPREGFLFSSDEARSGEEPKAAYAVRAGDLALVELRSGDEELFDLSVDPRQETNLASRRPEDVARLVALRERLAEPRSPAPPPALIVEGVGAPTRVPQPTAPVLSFDFSPEGDPLENLIARPALRSMLLDGAGLRDGAIRLARAPDGVARAHAALPAHPSFGFGRSSFTFSARVRLDEDGLERAAVACARPLERELRYTDWAVLARSGEVPAADLLGLSAEERASRARRIGVLFGDPTLSNRGLEAAERQPTVPVTSSLSIDDHAWHALTVTYDAAASTLRFQLDEAVDVVPVPPRAHYPSDGPLVFGACLDREGMPEWPLVGALDDLALARGAGPIVVPEGTLEGVLDLGELDVSEGTHVAHVVLRNPIDAAGRGRALTVHLDTEGLVDRRVATAAHPDRIRVTFEGARVEERTLLPGQSVTLDLALDLQPGPIEASFTVVATDALLGTLAAGTPLRVTIRGRANPGRNWIGLIEAGVLGSVVLVAGLSLARRRARK